MDINKYTGEPYKRQWLFLFLIIALAILYTNGFSYVSGLQYGRWIQIGFHIFLLGFLLLHWPKDSRYNFKTDVLLLAFLPLLSCVNTKLLYGQSYFDSMRILNANFVWILYFVLHKNKVQEATILKAFLALSLFIVGVQIIQQFTYPNALFGVASEDSLIENGRQEIAEERNGLWRFRLGNNAYFTCVVLFAFLMWARKKVTLQLVVIIGLMLVSVYLTLTRQVIASCLLAVFLSFFLGKKNKGFVRAAIIGVVLLSLVYAYSDVLFGSLAEQTSEDLNDSNIRILSATYFWTESISSPLVFLFGHGQPVDFGNFRNLTDRLTKMMGFYTADVGFIGMIYTYGIIYVLICYRLLWRLFFTYKKYVPLYIRTFVIFTGAMSIMIFPMFSATYYLVWVMLIYISDIYINRVKVVSN